MLFLGVNTIAWCIPLYLFALCRFLGPASIAPWCTQRAMNIAEFWIAGNSSVLSWLGVLDVEFELPDVDYNKWYLVISNHQSWTDIFILQYMFNRRIPLLKFFIKQSLLYVPVIGVAWWVLDFPVMKRYSRDYLEKHPEKRGQDLETTRKSCEHFRHTPVAVLNFLEGTRFTSTKQAAQQSPFQHLLKPRAGGAALVLDTLGEEIDCILDVTINYNGPAPTLFEYVCSRGRSVSCLIHQRPIPDSLPFREYDTDNSAKEEVQAYFNGLWKSKDTILTPP